MSVRESSFRESDTTAGRGPALAGRLRRKCAGPRKALEGDCEACRKTELARSGHAGSSHDDHDAPPIVHEVLRSEGRPLGAATRAFMEPRFGRDFSQVRVHADERAARSAAAVDALAYTVGNDIVWGRGSSAPDDAGSRRLLAHELVHTIQQDSSSAQSSSELSIASSTDPSERRADAIADGVLRGENPIALESTKSAGLQRSPDRSDATRPGQPIRYKEAQDLNECTRIMGSENAEFCRREVLGEKVPDASLGVRAVRVLQDLRDLIAGATWKEIRKRVYPKESAAGVKRAKDRKAGTLPDLTGLGRIRTLEHFAGAVRGIQTSWPSLAPDERVKKLGDAANVELRDAEVPGFRVVDKQPMEFKGFFLSDPWSFTISESLVTTSPLSDPDAAEVANTALHESRHAEQTFLAARFSAGAGKDVATIVSELKVPDTIAREARSKKFDRGTDPKVAALGREMFKAKVTEGPTNQRISDDDGIADLAVRKSEAQIAERNLSARVDSGTFGDAIAKRNGLRAQIVLVEQRYTLYRNIPYEADAHEVGDAAEQAFKGWP